MARLIASFSISFVPAMMRKWLWKYCSRLCLAALKIARAVARRVVSMVSLLSANVRKEKSKIVKVKELPESLFAAASARLSHYTIAFIEITPSTPSDKVQLLGSGVLVKAGSVHELCRGANRRLAHVADVRQGPLTERGYSESEARLVSERQGCRRSATRSRLRCKTRRSGSLPTEPRAPVRLVS